MSEGDPLTPQAVQDLVGQNRVAKATNYHANKKNIRLDDILLVLMGCTEVRKDSRFPHPNGWVAWGPKWGGGIMRVDFNRELREDGSFLLVVTAMEILK